MDAVSIIGTPSSHVDSLGFNAETVAGPSAHPSATDANLDPPQKHSGTASTASSTASTVALSTAVPPSTAASIAFCMSRTSLLRESQVTTTW